MGDDFGDSAWFGVCVGLAFAAVFSVCIGTASALTKNKMRKLELEDERGR